MREAATVLGLVRDRGTRRLPLEDVYRMLYNPQLYLLAYENLRLNDGALTPGSTAETVDGMALEKIQRIIAALRNELYRWTPVKRIYIPKKNGQQRPLGLPTWSDKLVQEVMRLILEAYYEPQFSRHAHGFRPNRNCHTALAFIQREWTGTVWFIEGDISKCFDKIDHDILLKIMEEKIHDKRFLRLLSYMLKAGYVEDWKYHKTYSGTPQGGVISPILSNIYLDKLDRYVETILAPEYNRGKRRKENPAYKRLRAQIGKAKGQGDGTHIRQLLQERRLIPSISPDDPTYRRLKYVRYADDFLIGFVGPKKEAQEIKEKLHRYLGEHLNLELSVEKTLITHARSERARFLSYEIQLCDCQTKLTNGRRSVSGHIQLYIPQDKRETAIRRYMQQGKPRHRPELQDDSDYAIVQRYQTEYRGVVNYYLMAHNIATLGKLHWAAQSSLLKTLANKHKTKVTTLVQRYRATTDTPDGLLRCLRVTVARGEGKPPLVAEFGGLPLRRQDKVQADDTPRQIWTQRTDLLDRLLAQRCELCGQEKSDRHRLVVHHIKKLADLKKQGKAALPAWKARMIALRRKTLVVCTACHWQIHYGHRTHRPAVAT